MQEKNRIEEQAARTILNNGVRYSNFRDAPRSLWGKIKRRFDRNGTITMRPLKYGVVLAICRDLASKNLNMQAIKDAGDDIPGFINRYGGTAARCIAIAMLNDRKKISRERTVRKKAQWLHDSLTNYQVYELFALVTTLSGMEDFMSTIGLLWTMKQVNLSPRNQGSLEDSIAPGE